MKCVSGASGYIRYIYMCERSDVISWMYPFVSVPSQRFQGLSYCFWLMFATFAKARHCRSFKSVAAC